MTKDQLQEIINSVSAFLKECPICEQRFKDTLDERTICNTCERDRKLEEILKYVKLK